MSAVTGAGAAYSADGVAIDRGEFYAIACDPARSVVVEACAGAGKTWMLVSRILRALLAGAEPQQILAITFTRKAAGEMRARLDEWLAEFAEPTASHAQRVEALRQRGLDAAQAEALAPALGQLHRRVLEGGRSVQVRTFHAWFSQLMRMAPLDVLASMGLQPGMALIEDTESLRPELMRRFLRRVARDPALVAAQRALIARHGRGLVQRWLDAAWSRRIEVERAHAAGTLADGVPPAAQVYADCAGLAHPVMLMAEAAWQDLLRQLASDLGRASGAKCQAAAAGLQAALAALAAGDLAGAQALASKAVLTDKGEPRKLPGDWPDLRRVADGLDDLALRVRQHEAHEDHGHMVALALALLEEFAALKRARALVDMSDLESVALQLLSEPEWAGWIQERLDAQLRHLLIDEFQDTSPMQWHALQPWLSAYAGAGGGASGQQGLSVFIVGDPKQSIYRFRRAEPRVFAAAAAFVAEALDGRLLACDHTRRNARGVIDTLNAVFLPAEARGEYAGYRTHTTEVAEAGDGIWALPRVERPPRGPRGEAAERRWRDSLREPRHTEQEHLGALEARWVARAIAELLADGAHRPGQIQVLARKRSTLARLADALRVLHIPHVRPDELSLAREPEALDLIALLDVLASPAHDLSLAQALRSPVFGASDDDLQQLARAARGGGWWSALQAVAATGEASPALDRAARLLARWAPLARAWPPHDLLDAVIHEGEVMARMQQAVPPERRGAARAVVEGLLGAALSLDGGRYASPYGLVRTLRRESPGVPALAQADAVQLLTVHGAKGLEAEVVFLMDNDPERRQAEAGSLLVDWPVELDHPRQVAFVASGGRRAPSLQALQDQEAAEGAREELNALYVALTRARRRLVFSSVAPHGKPPGSAWWDRLLPLASPWEPAEAHAGQVAAQAPVEVDDWAALAPQAPSEAGIAADWAAPVRVDSRATRLGEAFHRLMQWACGPAGPWPGDLPALDDWLARHAPLAGAEFLLLPEELPVPQAAARRVLASPAFRAWWDDPAIDWAGDEVPVSEGGESLRIDRLVARREAGGERVWWVLDYKLEHAPQDEPAYRAQLARYVVAVQALQPGETVRAALVSGAGAVHPIALAQE